jgi:hypothetical protein
VPGLARHEVDQAMPCPCQGRTGQPEWTSICGGERLSWQLVAYLSLSSSYGEIKVVSLPSLLNIFKIYLIVSIKYECFCFEMCFVMIITSN